MRNHIQLDSFASACLFLWHKRAPPTTGSSVRTHKTMAFGGRLDSLFVVAFVERPRVSVHHQYSMLLPAALSQTAKISSRAQPGGWKFRYFGLTHSPTSGPSRSLLPHAIRWGGGENPETHQSTLTSGALRARKTTQEREKTETKNRRITKEGKTRSFREIFLSVASHKTL